LLTDQEPTTIGIPIVLRDFDPTHVDFELDRGTPKEPDGDDHAIVRATLGAPGDSFISSGTAYNMNHKPVYANQACTKTATPSAANNWDKCTTTTFNANSFQQWYRDVSGVNTPHVQTLTLNRIGTNAYRFDSAANGGDGFFPLDAFGTSARSARPRRTTISISRARSATGSNTTRQHRRRSSSAETTTCSSSSITSSSWISVASTVAKTLASR